MPFSRATSIFSDATEFAKQVDAAAPVTPAAPAASPAAATPALTPAATKAKSGSPLSFAIGNAQFSPLGFVDFTGVARSTLTISGNSTVAEASANRASNTLSIDGPASLGASAALNNVQTNASAVNASASTDVGVALNGGAGLPYYAALNGGAVAVQGNSTAALARGNAATNVLNATPGANYASTWNDATVTMTYGGSPATGASSASAQAAACVQPGGGPCSIASSISSSVPCTWPSTGTSGSTRAAASFSGVR